MVEDDVLCLDKKGHSFESKRDDFPSMREFLHENYYERPKTKDLYPSEIENLPIKVSFGMGNPANVSWISILGQGMSTSDGYYPVFLYYKKENLGRTKMPLGGENWVLYYAIIPRN